MRFCVWDNSLSIEVVLLRKLGGNEVKGLIYQHVSSPFGTRASLAPTTSTFFWFWAIEIPVRVGDPVVGEQ
ncbi:MAG: hypothetical protein LBQ66_05575 [Planctomycetaceae bacterium]|jgi:hypothetical protein|nr:hypothetical protein [Planctomycetaceae bacterium]